MHLFNIPVSYFVVLQVCVFFTFLSIWCATLHRLFEAFLTGDHKSGLTVHKCFLYLKLAMSMGAAMCMMCNI